ncbi:hypothetical protein QTO34_014425 [Cnephaeus nilssonii]|uniref:Uncharacterized protein n=1 Tax=Cnephaeus nilssonii TaxID=3371016 RepID=A0AA40I6C2_CNENI|nr:hypothetical protein QTO34_014425 [Eptesicus nilssonii]
MFPGPRPLSARICKLTAILFALIGCGRSKIRSALLRSYISKEVLGRLGHPLQILVFLPGFYYLHITYHANKSYRSGVCYKTRVKSPPTTRTRFKNTGDPQT